MRARYRSSHTLYERTAALLAVILFAVPAVVSAQLTSPNFQIDGFSIGEFRQGTATSTNFDAGFAPGPVYIFDVSNDSEPEEEPEEENGGGGSSGSRPPSVDAADPDVSPPASPPINTGNGPATNPGSLGGGSPNNNTNATPLNVVTPIFLPPETDRSPGRSFRCPTAFLNAATGRIRADILLRNIATSSAFSNCPVSFETVSGSSDVQPPSSVSELEPLAVIEELPVLRLCGDTEGQSFTQEELRSAYQLGLLQQLTEPIAVLFRNAAGEIVESAGYAAAVSLSLPGRRERSEGLFILRTDLNGESWDTFDCVVSDSNTISFETSNSNFVIAFSIPASVGVAGLDLPISPPDLNRLTTIGYWLAPIGIGSGIISTLFALLKVPFSLSNFGYVFASRTISSLYALITFWKRRKPWGTVYDSRTKAPLDPAYVELYSETGDKVAEAITDLDGRYGFLVPTGTYVMNVQRSNYTFPATHYPKTGYDVLYTNLYYGGPVTVDAVVAHDIPMDQTDYDWNQEEKLRTDQYRFYRSWDPIMAALLQVLFFLGLVAMVWQFFVTPSPLAGLLLGIYVILFLLRVTRGAPPLYGLLTKDGQPLAFAVIRAFSNGNQVIAKVADEHGRFVALVPPNTYWVQIEQRVAEEQYELVYEGEVSASGGVINKSLRL